jgi:hypothetical protein
MKASAYSTGAPNLVAYIGVQPYPKIKPFCQPVFLGLPIFWLRLFSYFFPTLSRHPRRQRFPATEVEAETGLSTRIIFKLKHYPPANPD